MKKLYQKIINQEFKISFYGLGYVGLPLLLKTAKYKKIQIIGCDVNKTIIDNLKNNISHVDDVTNELLKETNESSNILYTAEILNEGYLTDISIICVPTPVDEFGIPKLDYILSSGDTIGKLIAKNKDKLESPHLIVLESTTYPTTTENDLRKVLDQNGLNLGTDYQLCFSPERIDPGNKQYSVSDIPKVVGGMTSEVSEVVKLYYEKIIGTTIHIASSPRTAEMTKLFENIFRQVNIALVNEMAMLTEKMEIDIFEVIKLASTKPFAFMPHYPGPGLGGHCIPVDPYYLSYIAKKYQSRTRFIDLASEINDSMTNHTIDLVIKALNNIKKSVEDSKILVFGVTYKTNVQDMRNSPAIPIIDKLSNFGAKISIHDNYIDEDIVSKYFKAELIKDDLKNYSFINSDVDLILIITPHSYYNFEKLIESIPITIPIVDTRGIIDFEKYRKFDVGLGRFNKKLNPK